MVSFLLIIRRVLKGIRGAWHQAPFRAGFLILLALLVSGTVFYSTVEEWSIVDSLYFSVITLATVGYGDFAPRTTAGKLFTIFYIFVGIGLFVGVATAVARGYAAPKSERDAAEGDDGAGKS